MLSKTKTEGMDTKTGTPGFVCGIFRSYGNYNNRNYREPCATGSKQLVYVLVNGLRTAFGGPVYITNMKEGKHNETKKDIRYRRRTHREI